jgi:hypothetical protein
MFDNSLLEILRCEVAEDVQHYMGRLRRVHGFDGANIEVVL